LLCALLGSPAAAQERAPAEITVFAAASLTEAFRELSRMAPVRFNFAGSQQLAVQLALGASADVFASADQRWMDYVQERKLVEGEPRTFAHNRLVVIVPKSNPARIRRLEDLVRRGIKLVVAAEAVPVGRYSREVIRKLAGRSGFPPGYEKKVLANVVSQEENVKSVVAKVQLGEADVGFVYRSDVTPQVARDLTVLEIPDDANVLAGYPIAVLAGSRHPDAARAFVELVLSPEGGKVLARHGLMPVGSTP
ncbi:MAG: molybdate ABC transporter substrate-binding protein, partial [Gemmatimonadales bacterium]